MTLSSQHLALLAALATGVQTGAAMVATRYVAGDLGPGSLGFLRYGLAALLLTPFLIAAGGIRVERRDLAPLILLGVAQFGILIVLLNFGVERMSAGRAALLFSTFPLLTMVIGALLGRERLTVAKTVGVMLSFLGVAATLGEGVFANAGGGEEEWIGALAVLGSALCGALCTVFSQPYLARYPTLSVGMLAIFSSVVFLGVMAAGEGLFTTPLHLDGYGWGAVIFVGASSALGYMMWLWALKHISPTRVAVFLSVGPATAAVLGLVLLGEPLTFGTVLGIVLVTIGLWVATRVRPDR